MALLRRVYARLAQPRQRRLQPLEPRHRLGAALALLLDHLGRRLGDELLVAELLVDLADLDLFLGDLALQPDALGVEIDDAGERQGEGRLADRRSAPNSAARRSP